MVVFLWAMVAASVKPAAAQAGEQTKASGAERDGRRVRESQSGNRKAEWHALQLLKTSAGIPPTPENLRFFLS
jgi:hypothetical protein